MRLDVMCLGCGKILENDDGKLLCKDELSHLVGVGEKTFRCVRCDQELIAPTEDMLCYDCWQRVKKGEVFLKDSQAIFFYRGVGRELYQLAKFEGNKRALLDIQQRAREVLQKRDFFPEVDVVTLVPSHWYTLLRRGYSPVEWFWSPWFPNVVRDVLVRRWTAKNQKKLRREERLRMVRDQFIVKRKDLVVGKRVLVLDDVYTTGSTLEEVARVLRLAGAQSVQARVIFRD
ncbi:phosphoribosyltransferase family protein [Thermospira aquatica]|uniref:Phosphoribosyltransferase domain-containing protein n=1 Tax=Thermospira aquatica TaxID=2828656 RepID=A0AAX3BD59_9SPIR|nr:phosphoribosyltransferase family protein [Thermospira aquatica]URA10174.1 hypothetical protein KDW03_11955 [Thermospira aquatica]